MMGTGYTDYFDSRWKYKLMFAWWPHKLDSTGRRVWLKQVYLGTRTIRGSGEPVILHKYLTPEEYIWEMLIGHAQ